MTPPNVILCVADQLRPFELGCYGHPVVRTPHLDRLAKNGVRFEVACSNNPVCTPARACLLTGQYSRTCQGMRGNVGDPDAERRHLPDTTVAEAFRAAGYDTALIGKWHVQPRPDLVGFAAYDHPSFAHRYRQRRYFSRERGEHTVESWTWDYEMRLAEQFLAAHRERPFFLYFNIEPPHMPLADAPEHYTQMYRREQVILRPNAIVNGQPAYDAEWFLIYLWDHLYYQQKLHHTLELPPGFDLRDLTALYYGMTTLVDDQVGKLVAALEENGLLDNTILLFTADHGDDLGSHGGFNKCRLSEESIRVPMILHWPSRLQPAHVTSQVASLVDVMPTLLGLAEVPVPASVQGVNLAPVIRSESKTTGTNCAFIEALLPWLGPQPWREGPPATGAVAIRTLQHLYGMGLQDASAYQYRPENDRIIEERLMFYDLASDPFQMRNLARTDEQSAKADKMRERLLEWHQQTPWLPHRT